MKTILIKDFIKKYWSYILFVIMLIIIIIAMNTCTNYKRNYNIYKHNLEISNDLVTNLQLKNGELLSYNNSLIIDKKELEDQLNISKKELKDIEKKLDAAIVYISKIETNTRIDSIIIENVIIERDTNTIVYTFQVSDSTYYYIGGKNILNDSLLTTFIDSVLINIPLKVGLDYEKKIFVTTPNPYVNITSIEGAVIDKKYFNNNKKWSLGLHVGFGAQYGLVRQKFDFGPVLSIGVSYNLLSW